MPSSSNLSDCRKTRMACWSLVPGPRASWSTMTLIFWPDVVVERPRTIRHANPSCQTQPLIRSPQDLFTRRRCQGFGPAGRVRAPALCRIALLYRALETQLEGKLNQTRVVYSLGDYPEIGRSSVRTCTVLPTSGQVELWMVKEIEELRPEFQVRTLAEGQREVLVH